MTYEIRHVAPDEVDAALKLALEVFLEFEASDYKPEGVETFKSFIRDERLTEGFKTGLCPMLAAFGSGEPVGVIGMRATKTHINLMFVKREYQRRGIATALFRSLLGHLTGENPALSEITLNSSPYGLPFYLRLGFVPTSAEREEDGIRYTPMKFSVKGDNNGI
ncbi:MAG: GNAT family N-acetyltransferase [Lachnospiraceae bacterium]|nr:GNAT family N-acetyltransferase [Ruminococcus sp.]MCM1274119.1 GNAT family N-acetyltransferase [Lachnospiraceae bacterium]